MGSFTPLTRLNGNITWGDRTLDTAENYRFENNLSVYVRGIQYGPFVTPGGTVVPCNVTV
jgi:hypothetical protein